MSSRAADARIDDVQRDLEFLISDNPMQMNEAQIVDHIQFHDYTHNEESDGRIDYASIQTPKQLRAELDRIRATWSPRHTTNPVTGWRARVRRIQENHSALGAFRNFENLRRDMAYFAGVAREAAFELDGWIQQEIDRMQGK